MMLTAALLRWFFTLERHGRRLRRIALRPDLWLRLADETRFTRVVDLEQPIYVVAPWGPVRIDRRKI